MAHEQSHTLEIQGEEILSLESLKEESTSDVTLLSEVDQDGGVFYSYHLDDSEQVTVVWCADGDETTSVGDKSWVKYAPARRFAPLELEMLWAIPQNWTRQYFVEDGFDTAQGIYTVDGDHSIVEDVAVHVRFRDEQLPNKKPFEVMKVGTLSYTPDSDIRQIVQFNKIYNTAHHLKIDVEDEVDDLLRDLYRSSDRFELNYVGELSIMLEDAVHDMYQPPNAELPSFIVTPINEPDFIHGVIQNVTGSTYDEEVRKSAIDVLHSEGVISREHPVRISINSFDEYPDRLYHIMAIIEAGYTPSQTIDYVMTEKSGFAQVEWAAVRSVSQSTVSSNAAEVRQNMFHHKI